MIWALANQQRFLTLTPQILCSSELLSMRVFCLLLEENVTLSDPLVEWTVLENGWTDWLLQQSRIYLVQMRTELREVTWNLEGSAHLQLFVPSQLLLPLCTQSERSVLFYQNRTHIHIAGNNPTVAWQMCWV